MALIRSQCQNTIGVYKTFIMHLKSEKLISFCLNTKICIVLPAIFQFSKFQFSMNEIWSNMKRVFKFFCCLTWQSRSRLDFLASWNKAAKDNGSRYSCCIFTYSLCYSFYCCGRVESDCIDFEISIFKLEKPIVFKQFSSLLNWRAESNKMKGERGGQINNANLIKVRGVFRLLYNDS